MRIKTILVTGGSGLVGSAIKQISKEYQYNFVFLTSELCDLTDYSQTKELFKHIDPDYVIHLAACVKNEPIKMLNDNLLINLNVLQCAYDSKIYKLITCLSTCIFPEKAENINESMLHNGPPHESNECYAYAKRILDIQCKYYNKLGCMYTCVIPTNIYGSFDNFNLNDSHVIPGLIHQCYLAKQSNKPFVVKGTGKPLRQIIYNIDLAKVIMELFNGPFVDKIIVAQTQEYSIKQIAELIAQKFKVEIIVFDETFSDGQIRKTVDNSKLINIIDFEFTKLEQGISNTIDWFLKNYNTLRK
jgi:GDP-L-fucose synthase